MTAQRAHAPTVSRILARALDGTSIRRSDLGGYTVRQYTADTVEVEWHGPSHEEAAAYKAITAALDGTYDVTATDSDRWRSHSYTIPVLRVTPGTAVADVEGTQATADDVKASSYVSRAPWDDEHTAPRYATAAEVRDAIDRTREGHGTATVDPATGVITLHQGKARTERHTLTPSTPEQRAAHRTELERTAAHWADQARRATEEAARLRGAADTCHPDQRHHVATRLRAAEDQAQRSHEAAAQYEDAAQALDGPPDPVALAVDLSALADSLFPAGG